MTDSVDAQASLEAVLKDEESAIHTSEATSSRERPCSISEVGRFQFRKESTQNSAEAYGVKAVMMTALKPHGDEEIHGSSGRYPAAV